MSGVADINCGGIMQQLIGNREVVALRKVR